MTQSTGPRLRIGIAVVEHVGRFVVGVRSLHGPQPGKAEFPGGKCEPEESPIACVVRECREETGLDVEPVTELAVVRTKRLELHFWRCQIDRQSMHANPELAQPFRWVSRAELAELDFPEANAAVILRLTAD